MKIKEVINLKARIHSQILISPRVLNNLRNNSHLGIDHFAIGLLLLQIHTDFEILYYINTDIVFYIFTLLHTIIEYDKILS